MVRTGQDRARARTWSRESNRGNRGPALSTSAVAAALRAANAEAVFLPYEILGRTSGERVARGEAWNVVERVAL